MTSVAGGAVTGTELWRMSATGLAEAIRSRQVPSREVIEAHLRRIEAVNPLINAVTVVLGDQALQAAKGADGAIARGGELPPFHGVPFTVKENIDLAGTAATQGAKALAEAYPSRDAPVVERLKAAGAIPIGRTNLPTYGVGWVCESGGPDLARPMDGAGTAARRGTTHTGPGGSGGRPGRPGHRQSGAGRGAEGGYRVERCRLRRGRTRAAVDRGGGEDRAGHAHR